MSNLFGFAVAAGLLVVATPALAQIKPATSGKQSFHEPEFRRHGSGLHHPHQPHHHRHSLSYRR